MMSNDRHRLRSARGDFSEDNCAAIGAKTAVYAFGSIRGHLWNLVATAPIRP
jgi:hypothetical protein